jgi:hypothetical protein
MTHGMTKNINWEYPENFTPQSMDEERIYATEIFRKYPKAKFTMIVKDDIEIDKAIAIQKMHTNVIF